MRMSETSGSRPKEKSDGQAVAQRNGTGGHCIVAIGASAGGLKQLQHFFENMPADSGLSFVIIQHLDPTFPSNMAALIGNVTRMKLVETEDGMRVEPDHVYMIPPGRYLGIRAGVLLVYEPDEPRGLRIPIDHFFRALAADQ